MTGIQVAVAAKVDNRTVTFTVTGATPPIEWGWGDGTGETGPDLVQGHDYARPGLYTAILSAKEGRRSVPVGVAGVGVSGPHISRIDPSAVALNSGPFTLAVYGRNFPADALVVMGGVAIGIDTTVVDDSTLFAQVDAAADIPGSLWVQVWGTAPDGQVLVSNGVPFTVQPWPLAGAGGGALSPGAELLTVAPDTFAAGTTPTIEVRANADNGFRFPGELQIDGQTFTASGIQAPQSLMFDIPAPGLTEGTHQLRFRAADWQAWSNALTLTVTAAGVFDPGEHTVAEVVAYVEDFPDQLDTVYDAENAGKARVTLLDQLDAMRGT